MEKKENEKYRHSAADGRNLFPRFYWNFVWRVIVGVLGLIVGVMSLVIGSWADSGYEAFNALQANPWPMLTIEDRKYTATSLLMLVYTGWIAGALMIAMAMYSFWTALTLKSLLFDPRPWSKSTWSDLRKTADNILVNNGVRNEPLISQFQRLNQDQQEDMIQYKTTEDPEPEI